MTLMENVQRDRVQDEHGHDTIENINNCKDNNNNIQVRRMRKTQLSKKEFLEKRKSDVLIAAKSLDTEIQNVKNLKRLSIGSMDLVIDPELEFKVSGRNSYSSESSKESIQESLHELNTVQLEKRQGEEQVEEQGEEQGEGQEDEDDEYEDGNATNVDDSIDVTQTEYLHDEETLEKEKTSRNASSSTSYSARVTSSNRRLSGVKSFAHHEILDVAEDYNSSTANLTQNLLWVPANQHPNVKPENYLELVQDTLQNIQITTDQDPDGKKSDQGNSHVFSNRQRSGSIVRRPSHLKTSYTKFDDEPSAADRQRQVQGHDQAEKRISSLEAKTIRSVSLKEITEELTKISDNAGLTDSDAITLARSLSMSGSFTNESLHLGNNKIENDNEFASNMFNKSGLTIPERSLRRSKFNTYKIRSDNSELPPTARPNNSMNVKANDDRRSASSPASYIQPPQDQAPLNDFQEIFEHYRRTSTDWGTENTKYVDSTNYYSDEEDLTHASISQDSSFLSTDSSNNSVLVKPNNAGSMISERLDQDIASSENEDVNINEPNHGWSWLNSTNENLANNDSAYEQVIDDEEENGDCVGDEKTNFVNLSVSRRAMSTKRASERINHSKNRHSPIFQMQSDESKSVVVTSSVTSLSPSHSSESAASAAVEKERGLPNDDKPSAHKKKSLEKRLVRLFKRKQHNKNSKSDAKVIKKNVKQELKKKTSHSSLSKFRKSPKKKSRQIEVVQDRPSSPVETASSESLNTAIEIELVVESPADSIIFSGGNTNHSSESVVETINELDGDDSFDISGGEINYSVEASANMGKDPATEPNETVNEEEEVIVPTLAPQISTLLPKRLTFEDIVTPEYPNAPIKFTDSAFGFPLPMITNSTVIMFDHRLGINVERAIYRLSHLKLSDPGRELRQQVLLSNFMYSYLNLVNHTLYMEQIGSENAVFNGDSALAMTDKNDSDGTILIPDI
ncbi:hypothetical protein SEUBUCD646_0M00380 [Saccharomyces eubayanus]|uniref:Protein Zds1 C-terminal domain-containing protein n=1 Tax=Saccharomyces eubayanus TaxID=1080349 RepID=A0ABN8VI04_SACEU|nr:hypothetical protein SEUBUCD650_0M00370 [Saccharomyces eubayanus]CAI1641594.1 hypothetical protein SEUBUCD646_0M00380 [Saccharomyces eubayanus]